MIKKIVLLVLMISFLHVQSQDFIEHPIDMISGDVENLRLADLDNDGNIDIIAVVNGSQQLLVWFNQGNQDFSDPVVVENESGSPAKDIGFLDINNDGIMDIVAILFTEENGITFERLVYYINNGDRTFENFASVEPNTGSSINLTFEIFDVDNDSFNDIVVRRVDNNLVYYPNTGNGSFTPPILILSNVSREVLAQDFNGDNLMDIVLSGGSPKLLQNNGDATFTETTEFADYPQQQFATRIVTGAFDNDITSDLLITNTNFSNIAGVIWYSNDGLANFTFEENITHPSFTGDTYTIARIADFNNDGNNDLIAGVNFSAGSGIPYWLNDGNSDFTPSLIQSTSDEIDTSLEVFDFNQDGKMDFIVGTQGGKITWFENNFTLSLEDNDKDNLTIVPNPSTGIYTISGNQNETQYLISIYNTIGQEVDISTNNKVIDLTSQPSGIYYAKFVDQSSTFTKKIVKH